MKRLAWILVTCLLLTHGGPTEASILRGNFLPNPDLEWDGNVDGVPDDWSPRSAPGAIAGWQATRPSAGQYHLLLDDRSAQTLAEWSAEANLPFAVEELELQWSWAYEFTSGRPDDQFLVSVEWFQEGLLIGHNSFVARDPQPEYQLVNKIVVVPDDTDSLRIRFASGSTPRTTGLLYVDEVSISIPGAGEFGDLNGDGKLNAPDLDLHSQAEQRASSDDYFDLNGDSTVDLEDRAFWVEWVKLTYFGDANMDFRFDSSDLIQVFRAGEYEDDLVANSTWETGDWNGDLEFDSADIIWAFRDGGYEQGFRVAVSAVPEPSLGGLGWLLVMAAIGQWRRNVGKLPT